MTKNAVADGKGQVETTPIPFQMVDDAQTLLVVAKAGEGLGQGGLTGMPERGVTEIVAEPDRLDEVLVEEERAADGAGDLGHLEGMGEAGPVVVAGGSDKDLGLVHQPAKALGVEDAIAVALERGSQVALRLWRGPLRSAARRAGGREQLLLARFQSVRESWSRCPVTTYPWSSGAESRRFIRRYSMTSMAARLASRRFVPWRTNSTATSWSPPRSLASMT